MFVRVKLGMLAGSPINEPLENSDYMFANSREVGSLLASQARKTDVCSLLFGIGNESVVTEVESVFQLILSTLEYGASDIKLNCKLPGGQEMLPDSSFDQTHTSGFLLKSPSTASRITGKTRVDVELIKNALVKFYSFSDLQYIYYEACMKHPAASHENSCMIRVYFLPAWVNSANASNSGSRSRKKSVSRLLRSISPESQVLEISTSQDLWKLDRKSPHLEERQTQMQADHQSRSKSRNTDSASDLSPEATLLLCSVIRTICPDNTDPALENALLSGGLGTHHPLLLFVVRLAKTESAPTFKLKRLGLNGSLSGTSLRESKTSDYKRLLKASRAKIEELRNNFYKEYSNDRFMNDVAKWKQSLKLQVSPRSPGQKTLDISRYSQLPAIGRKPLQKSVQNSSGHIQSPKALLSPPTGRTSDSRVLFRIETKGYLAGLFQPRRLSPPPWQPLAGDSLGKINLHHIRLRARD